MYAGDQRFADYEVTNFSYDPVFILNVLHSRNVSIRYTTKKLLPDSSAVLRIQYNPPKTGKFKEKIQVFMSDHKDPITLTMTGNVQTIEMNQDLACPDFTVSVTPVTPQAQLSISVLDSRTEKPIPGAKVTLLSAGIKNRDLKTVVDGSDGQDTPIGLYRISASAKGYYTASQVAYIGVNANHLTMYLEPEEDSDESFYANSRQRTKEVSDLPVGDRKTEGPSSPKSKSVSERRQKSAKESQASAASSRSRENVSSEQVELSQPEIQKPNILLGQNAEPRILSESVDESELLPESEFKPNNVVFLIDISTSMTHLNKLELLKLAIIRLSKQLRPIDKMSIVSYQSQAEVIMEPIVANQAEQIADLLLPIEAKGRTAGGKGISLAYEVLNSAYIEGGNNEILLATDGVFNVEEDKDYLKLIKKNAKLGNRISVIGVKNKAWTAPSMQYIADKGKGNYIHIEDEEDTEDLLLHALKTNSRINPE